MIKSIFIILFLLLPSIAYCDSSTWIINASKQDLIYINKFNNSLPICIQNSIPQTLKITVIDKNSNLIPQEDCGYSYSYNHSTIIVLHNNLGCSLNEIYAHELGHHYDWFVGISEDPVFKQAFKQDFKLIHKHIRNMKWLSDPAEVAAELFALEFMGSKQYYGSLNSHDMQLFPRSKFIFEQHLCVMPNLK